MGVVLSVLIYVFRWRPKNDAQARPAQDVELGGIQYAARRPCRLPLFDRRSVAEASLDQCLPSHLHTVHVGWITKKPLKAFEDEYEREDFIRIAVMAMSENGNHPIYNRRMDVLYNRYRGQWRASLAVMQELSFGRTICSKKAAATKLEAFVELKNTVYAAVDSLLRENHVVTPRVPHIPRRDDQQDSQRGDGKDQQEDVFRSTVPIPVEPRRAPRPATLSATSPVASSPVSPPTPATPAAQVDTPPETPSPKRLRKLREKLGDVLSGPELVTQIETPWPAAVRGGTQSFAQTYSPAANSSQVTSPGAPIRRSLPDDVPLSRLIKHSQSMPAMHMPTTGMPTVAMPTLRHDDAAYAATTERMSIAQRRQLSGSDLAHIKPKGYASALRESTGRQLGLTPQWDENGRMSPAMVDVVDALQTIRDEKVQKQRNANKADKWKGTPPIKVPEYDAEAHAMHIRNSQSTRHETLMEGMFGKGWQAPEAAVPKAVLQKVYEEQMRLQRVSGRSSGNVTPLEQQNVCFPAWLASQTHLHPMQQSQAWFMPKHATYPPTVQQPQEYPFFSRTNSAPERVRTIKSALKRQSSSLGVRFEEGVQPQAEESSITRIQTPGPSPYLELYVTNPDPPSSYAESSRHATERCDWQRSGWVGPPETLKRYPNERRQSLMPSVETISDDGDDEPIREEVESSSCRNKGKAPATDPPSDEEVAALAEVEAVQNAGKNRYRAPCSWPFEDQDNVSIEAVEYAQMTAVNEGRTPASYPPSEQGVIPLEEVEVAQKAKKKYKTPCSWPSEHGDSEHE